MLVPQAPLAAADRAFARLVGAPVPAHEELLGLEHEFVVRGASGVVDFRRHIHRLRIPGRRVDPYDPHAYRCAFGGTITADDAEAEVAIAPVQRAGGFTGVVDARARGARHALEAVLPPELWLEGYSTHLSVSTADRLNDGTARLVASRFSAALILLTDRAISPGLLVMPRPGRTELGVEYVEGARLRAAAAMAVGSVLAAQAITRHGATTGRGATARQLPPALDVEIRPAVRRFGWYVDRAAFGTDLLADGRAALLRRADGGTITAGDHLELAWDAARRTLAAIAAPADLADADRMVAGETPLPIEDALWSDPVERLVEASPTPFSELLAPRRRPGFIAEVVVATWDFAIFALVGTRRTGYASVPRSALGRFVAQVDAGRLDATIRDFLAGPDQDDVLGGWREAHRAGLYDRLAPLAAFAPPERDPTGEPWVFDLRASPAVPSPSALPIAADEAHAIDQPHKLGKVPGPPPVEVSDGGHGGGLELWWIVAIGLAVLILLGAGLVLTGGHTGTAPVATPPASEGSTIAPSSLPPTESTPPPNPTPGPVGLDWTGTTVELTFTDLKIGPCPAQYSRSAIPPQFGGGWKMATEPGAGSNVAVNMLGLPDSPFAPALNGSIAPSSTLHVTGDSAIESMDLTLTLPEVPSGPLTAPIDVSGTAHVNLHGSGGDCVTDWTVSGTAAPSTAVASEDPATVFQSIATAIRSGDAAFLFGRLNPAVIDRYGATQCRSFVQTIVHPTQTFAVLSVSGPAPWNWATDGLTTRIGSVYVLTVDRTLDGNTTREQTHLAISGDHLTWFTDCGTPQP